MLDGDLGPVIASAVAADEAARLAAVGTDLGTDQRDPRVGTSKRDPHVGTVAPDLPVGDGDRS